MEDSLKKDINKAITLVEQTGKSIFYGNLKGDKELLKQIVSWTGFLNSDNSLDGFISAFINSKSGILIVNGKVNDINLSSESFNEYLENNQPDDSDFIKESYNLICGKKNNIVSFKISFFENSVCYEFKRVAEWKKNYDIINMIRNNILRDDEYEKRLMENTRKNEIARKITADKLYLSAKDKNEREEVAIRLATKFGAKNIDDSWSISFIVEKIYNSEIKRKIEDELKEKIQELKRKGYTKIKIKGQLGITQSVLDKLYY